MELSEKVESEKKAEVISLICSSRPRAICFVLRGKRRRFVRSIASGGPCCLPTAVEDGFDDMHVYVYVHNFK